MRILLLYNGYPRLSQTYQIDEADEINKKHQVLIYSWAWPLYDVKSDSLPYIFKSPFSDIKTIEKFNPEIIHAHYLTNLELCIRLSKKLNIPFTIRSHSFDVLRDKKLMLKYAELANSEYCKGILCFPGFVDIFKQSNFDMNKIKPTYPSLYIKKFINDSPNGHDIMSGGACLPKKNIEEFIQIAKIIKNKYPWKNITYYFVQEDIQYTNIIKKMNIQNGSPIIFKTCQNKDMPVEYKKHQWLIYHACPKIKTVGYPLMIAEAQASGVGVLMYNLRPDLKDDYIKDSGYVYDTTNEILDIISNDFSLEKKEIGMKLCYRYDIVSNIKILEDSWL